MKRVLIWTGRIVLGLFIFCIFLQLLGVLFVKMFEWSSGPYQIDELTDSHCLSIEKCTGVAVPDSAVYIDGWHLSYRDPSTFYIFEIDLSQKNSRETLDEFVRRILSLEQDLYSSTVTSHFHERYSNNLPELEYAFTDQIEYLEPNTNYCDYGNIHYIQIDSNTLRIALEYYSM